MSLRRLLSLVAVLSLPGCASGPSKEWDTFVHDYLEASYAEKMMWDAGLGGGDLALKVGQLGDALLRNVRFVCAIGMHARGMPVKECERLFLEQGLQDPATAEQQAARGTFDPGYLNYTLGKLMIMKLRDEWTAPRGGRSAWGQFHDALLSYGGPPVPLIRRAMLGPNAGPPL